MPPKSEKEIAIDRLYSTIAGLAPIVYRNQREIRETHWVLGKLLPTYDDLRQKYQESEEAYRMIGEENKATLALNEILRKALG